LNQDGSRNGGCSIDPRQNVLHAYAQAPGKLAMAHELCSLADDALFFLFLFRHRRHSIRAARGQSRGLFRSAHCEESIDHEGQVTVGDMQFRGDAGPGLTVAARCISTH